MTDPGSDCLDARWCCLVCGWAGRLGAMRLPSRPPGGPECPRCGSCDTHPASGDVVELTEYHGPVGILN